jgi:hypothetical protein
MKFPEEYQHLLNTRGVALIESVGVPEIALERDAALLAIELLRKASIPILGGDVYVKRGVTIESHYSDWYTDPKPGEIHQSYMDRSWLRTEEYIKNYPQPLDGIPLFVLVVGH